MTEPDGIVNEYLTRLTESNRPDLVLASVLSALFGYSMSDRDWPLLGRLIRVYGRWRVFDSFLRASNSSTFDSKTGNIWGYFQAICLTILNEEKANNQSVFRAEKEKEETLKLIEALKRRPKHLKLKDKSWLILPNA